MDDAERKSVEFDLEDLEYLTNPKTAEGRCESAAYFLRMLVEDNPVLKMAVAELLLLQTLGTPSRRSIASAYPAPADRRGEVVAW